MVHDGLVGHRPGEPWCVSEAVVATERDRDGPIALLLPKIPKLEEVRGGIKGLMRVSWISIVHALAERGFNVLQLSPARLRDEGVSPKVASILSGAVIAFEARTMPYTEAFMRDCANEDIPVIVQTEGEAAPGFDQVSSDYMGGTTAMMRWLYDHGVTRMQRIWATRVGPATALRDAAYEQFCHEHGLRCLPTARWYVREPMRDRVAFIVHHLKPLFESDSPPEALLVWTDGMVDSITRALLAMGIRPNVDVAICGFNHYWDFYEHHGPNMVPPLLNIDKRTPQIGNVISAMLQERLADVSAPPMERVLPSRLVVNDEQLARWRPVGEQPC